MAGGINQYGYAGSDPINQSDPFGLDCQDKDGKRRPCNVSWSEVNKPNTAINAATMKMVQEVADASGHDLTLSSGIKPGAHAGGDAVDISAIDGVDVGQKQGDDVITNPNAWQLIGEVQMAAQANPKVRVTLGPSGIFASPGKGQPQQNIQDGSTERRALQKQHNDHIHLGRHP